MKTLNPYQRLLREVRQFIFLILHTTVTGMCYFGADSFTGPTVKAFRLDDVYHKTLAAQQLGHEVTVTADVDGLHFSYRKKVVVPCTLM